MKISHVFQLFNANGLLTAFLLGLFLSKIFPSSTFLSDKNIVNRLALITMLAAAACGVVYLYFPNYVDDIEADAALQGLFFLQGLDLYPHAESGYQIWPNGSVYGPLHAVISGAFISVFPLQDVMMVSKFPGVVAFLAFLITAIKNLRSDIAKGYLIFVFTFGAFLFWNRGEPLLVLITLLSFHVTKLRGFKRHILSGFLVGLAMSIKPHSVLYLIPFLFISLREILDEKRSLGVPLLQLMLGAVLAISLVFLPGNISIVNYVSYLALATKHGFVLRTFIENIILVIMMNVPVFWVLKSTGFRDGCRQLFIIAVLCQVITSFISSKAGAGSWHLIPYFVVNACLIENFHQTVKGSELLKLRYASVVMAVYILIAFIPRHMKIENRNLNMDKQFLAKEELLNLKATLDDAFIGASGSGLHDKFTNSLSNFRVYFQTENALQYPYANFRDLEASGWSDAALARAFRDCKNRVVILPSDSNPFGAINGYTGRSLFSNHLIESFKSSYEKTQAGKYFDVYHCKA